MTGKRQEQPVTTKVPARKYDELGDHLTAYFEPKSPGKFRARNALACDQDRSRGQKQKPAEPDRASQSAEPSIPEIANSRENVYDRATRSKSKIAPARLSRKPDKSECLKSIGELHIPKPRASSRQRIPIRDKPIKSTEELHTDRPRSSSRQRIPARNKAPASFIVSQTSSQSSRSISRTRLLSRTSNKGPSHPERVLPCDYLGKESLRSASQNRTTKLPHARVIEQKSDSIQRPRTDLGKSKADLNPEEFDSSENSSSQSEHSRSVNLVAKSAGLIDSLSIHDVPLGSRRSRSASKAKKRYHHEQAKEKPKILNDVAKVSSVKSTAGLAKVHLKTENPKGGQEETFLARPAVKIVIPDHLKSILVDDWEFVTKNRSLVPLPSPHPVNSILDLYFSEEKGRRRLGSAEADLLEEVVIGLKDYFENCLGRILLYRFEREQYLQVRKGIEKDDGQGDFGGKKIGDIYGAEHLCRLFVTLPELIAQTNMPAQAVRKLRDEIEKVTSWLSKNSTRFFVTEYETPGQDYADAARGQH